MRKNAGVAGVLMIVAGVVLVMVGAFWSVGVQGKARGEAYRTGWVCGPYFAQDSGADQHPCRVTGMSETEQAAGSAAGLAWVAAGGVLTVGGALLSGAVIMSAGRPERQQAPQSVPVPQQQYAPQQPLPQTGPFVPQPNYGQPRTQ